MNFEKTLIAGELIKRYKRFFVDVKIGNKTVVAHCPNTGSMMGLLKKGNKIWVSKSDSPKRKLKYTMQIIEDQKAKVGINTHLTNKIVLEALENKRIKNFQNIDKIIQEVKFGEKKKIFLEVKNVTLSRLKGKAEFPDAVTSRGLKHIRELLKAKKKGYEIYLLYVIQRNDCNRFNIAGDIDNKYCELLTKAVKKNLNVLCYDCKFSSKGIKLNRKLKFKI